MFSCGNNLRHQETHDDQNNKHHINQRINTKVTHMLLASYMHGLMQFLNIRLHSQKNRIKQTGGDLLGMTA